MSSRRSTRANSVHDSKMTSGTKALPTTILKPLPEPSSIKYVFLMIGIHLCKKIVFFNTYVRLLAYLTLLFALSSIADTLYIPKILISPTTRMINIYFVKLGWFWTLFLTIPFVLMTSYTYCCGKKSVVYRHLLRLGIATFFWFIWVSFFNYVQKLFGYCVEKRDLKTSYECVDKGFRWKGFDLSGHVFLLIYSNLILIEEARPILGWENIKDLIRDERYARDTSQTNFGPLRNLNAEDFEVLDQSYHLWLPHVRVNFIILTLFSIMWDFMLLLTVLYFHSMPEKLLSGVIAIVTWYFTYEIWFKMMNIPPIAPGEGKFIYYTREEKSNVKKVGNINRKNSFPSFVGIPSTSKNDKY